MHGIYLLDGVLSLVAAIVLIVFLCEPPHPPAPAGRAVTLALDALRQVFTVPVTLLLFLTMGLAQLGTQIAAPFLPLVVQALKGDRSGASAATDIGLVFGLSAIVGALLAPVGGWLGDRVGYRPMLVAGCVLSAASLAAIPSLGDLLTLTLAATGLGLGGAIARTMVTALVATRVPEERRTVTLNLVLVPSYLAGISGGFLGTVAVGGGLAWVLFARAVRSLCAASVATRLR